MADKVAVVGATGFIGQAVASALESRNCDVIAIPAPRLRSKERSPHALLNAVRGERSVPWLVELLRGARAVVNAAGDPDASSFDEDGLVGANGLLPIVVAAAAERAGVSRLVHISSAVVQNDIAVLDESEELRPFSPYSRSKVLGEEVLRDFGARSVVRVVRFRPPSVHAPERGVTRMVAQLARSPLASVARPGGQPTPQALLPNVADAVAYLATCSQNPPPVVMHPYEGVTCATLMRDLSGGHQPRRIPRTLARLAVIAAKVVGRWHRPTAANARRVELLWLGQRQAPSWLDDTGWRAPLGPAAWRALGQSAKDKR